MTTPPPPPPPDPSPSPEPRPEGRDAPPGPWGTSPAPPGAYPGGGVPYGVAPVERIRQAWQRRHETDYVFDFWTALGWTLLSCGVYGFYVLYQLVRRSRDHNLRRLELLDAATSFAWERAEAAGRATELRPAFERIAAHAGVLRQHATRFRDPGVWVLLGLISSGIAHVVAYVLLDGDLVEHDDAEGAIEAELSQVYALLGAPIPPPDPERRKGRHNYVGRVVATIATLGVYGLFWQYDVMTQGNRHFEHNWRWEDDLASATQRLAGIA